MYDEIKKILLNTNTNFLLGAGASKFDVDKPLPLMRDLIDNIIHNQEYQDCFREFSNENLDKIVKHILETNFIGNQVDIERGLSELEGLLPYAYDSSFKERLNKLICIIKRIIRNSILTANNNESAMKMAKFYYNIIIFNDTKVMPLKRINIFTTNYDMLTEMALEINNTLYYSGFLGTFNPKFNLANYNYKISEDIGLKNRNQNNFIPKINLYKLHGSLSWKLDQNSLTQIQDYEKNEEPVIIYPSSSKYYSTNIITYYSALFREFSNELNKENSTLVVIGSALNDDHINKILIDALQVPTFTLIILAYCESDESRDKTIKYFKDKFMNKSNVLVDASLNNNIEFLTENLFVTEGIINE